MYTYYIILRKKNVYYNFHLYKFITILTVKLIKKKNVKTKNNYIKNEKMQ